MSAHLQPRASHLWDRLHDARERLAPVQSRYRVVFEDPAEPDAPAKVLVPDPNWLACALAGGILPPIDAYLADAAKVAAWEQEHGTLEGFAWSLVGGASHPYAAPIGPMTEEEALEYLIQKDIPARVWADPTNRPRFAIVARASIPTDRTHRNAWKLNDIARAA
jgi:hypothetical protein